MPLIGLIILTPSSDSPSSGIISYTGAWCFWYDESMCDTNGLSLGRKLQDSSRAFACQNSLSYFTCTGFTTNFSLEETRNLSSVETQK